MAINLQTIADKLNVAKLYYISLLKEKRERLQIGMVDTSLKEVYSLKRIIRGLEYQVNMNVNDDSTLSLYRCLLDKIGTYSGLYVIDPTVTFPYPDSQINPDVLILYTAGNGISINNYIISTRNGRGLTYDNTGANTLDLDSTILVSPTISPNWALYKNDGVTPYTPPTSTSKNITVDKGVKANLSAVYQYPNPTGDQGVPTSVSGSFGTTLPTVNTPSAPPLVVNNISTDSTYQVILAKPKEGLIVVNNQVKFAEGNDTTTDSVSIIFRSKSYLGYSTNTSLTGADIIGLPNGAFVSSKTRTMSGVTATLTQYTYYCYEASFGALNNIIMDGAAPVLGAFTRLADVVVLNDAGINITYAVYKSNSTQAFTNNTLAFS